MTEGRGVDFDDGAPQEGIGYLGVAVDFGTASKSCRLFEKIMRQDRAVDKQRDGQGRG
jgi:hypothetical protein